MKKVKNVMSVLCVIRGEESAEKADSNDSKIWFVFYPCWSCIHFRFRAI